MKMKLQTPNFKLQIGGRVASLDRYFITWASEAVSTHRVAISAESDNQRRAETARPTFRICTEEVSNG